MLLEYHCVNTFIFCELQIQITVNALRFFSPAGFNFNFKSRVTPSELSALLTI